MNQISLNEFKYTENVNPTPNTNIIEQPKANSITKESHNNNNVPVSKSNFLWVQVWLFTEKSSRPGVPGKFHRFEISVSREIHVRSRERHLQFKSLFRGEHNYLSSPRLVNNIPVSFTEINYAKSSTEFRFALGEDKKV